MSELTIRPITLREAGEYINQYHRHHTAPQGCKFAVSCWSGDKLVGVAICGRPVARGFNTADVCEVTRLCTDGTYNACSKLYGACARIAKEMGYAWIITYILETELGTSLLASGWKKAADVRGRSWNTPGRPREDKHPTCNKQRWERQL